MVNLILLPQELIVEILLRLPVNSLVRFKCVCKSWLSLISDSKFAKSHYDLAAKPTYRNILITIFGVNMKSIDIESSLHDSTLTRTHVLPHRLLPSNYDILIYGSCRGFLLVHCDHANLLVWNPTTGDAKPISYSHVKSMYRFLYGLWYDASTDDYLVILVAMYDTRYYPTDWKTHIEIFSLKTDSWNQVEGFKFPYRPVYNGEAGLLLNRALHWLVYYSDTGDHVIIAFDLVQMSLSEIPIPLDIAMQLKSKSRLYYLTVLGACLCLCYPGEHHPDAAPEIWMMKMYKVQSSWTKSFVLPVNYGIPDKFYVLPLCSTKSEGFIGSNRRGGLLKYNDKGVLIEHTTFGCGFIINNIQLTAIYRESLLSLPGDFGETSEDDQQEYTRRIRESHDADKDHHENTDNVSVDNAMPNQIHYPNGRTEAPWA